MDPKDATAGPAAVEPETRPTSLKDDAIVNAETASAEEQLHRKKPLSKRILGVLWDPLEKTPEERRFIAKIDWWILTYCCVAYFVKYLDQTNVSSPERLTLS
jgi:ACS family pantothenate transporter-like MFS transporter